jgi:hypothetical protein
MSERLKVVVVLVVVIVLGLVTRRFHHDLPSLVGEYAPDTLWALAVFLFFRLLLPRVSTLRCATIAAVFSVSIEVSQLYQAPWINAIRRTTLGGLILGSGFLWSDIACYLVGVGIGAGLDSLLLKRRSATA